MARLRIDVGTAITIDSSRRVIDDAVITIDDDRIEFVGERSTLAGDPVADEVIDGSDLIALPGFIDCHAHAGHGLLKSLGTDFGDSWNHACAEIYAKHSDTHFWRAEAGLASLERLRFGVTCGVSLLGGGNDVYRSDDGVYARERAEAVGLTGIRDILAIGPCAPPYPCEFGTWRGERFETRSLSLEQQLQSTSGVIAELHDTQEGRVKVAVVAPVVHPTRIADDGRASWQQQACEARELSRQSGVLFTQDGHRKGSIAHAHEILDLLGPDVLLSHCVDLTNREIEIVAETNTRIAHNPSAIASIVGRCPAPELIEAGATVAIGSDATAPDRNADMLRHVQQCMHYHRRHFRDPGVLPPGKALEMITIDAATALGLDHELGSIEPGKKADIVLIDGRKPHLYPPQMPLYRVAYFANGSDVDTVVVNGNVLMRGRRVSHLNEDDVLNDAAEASERALARSGLRHLLDMPPNVWGRARF